MSGFINIPEILAVGYNFMPLDKTWYEEEFDLDNVKTIRFARREDHSGVLIQIDKAEFYEANP